jgi:predicted DNA-binding ribbon-helix-helix protein
MSRILKRSIMIAGHGTSVSLEPEFWEGLKELAHHRRISLAQLVAGLDAERQEEGNLSSALRLAVLAYYRDRTSEV